MAQRIARLGDDLVVALPEEALSSLGLGEGAHVNVSVDWEHGGILIKPVAAATPEFDAEFLRQLRGFVERYRPALDELTRER